MEARGQFIKASEIGTQGAKTLPGSFYTSPERFREEQERIFLQHWICVGREQRIPDPGDYFVCTMGTESVVVVRGRDGIVRALYNVCRHRGTRICEEAEGHFKNAIRCPYHAWTYALDGRLIAAPSMDEAAGFAPADYPLHASSLVIWEGFLFLSFATNPEPFETTHAPLLTKFRTYNLPTLHAARRIDYDVRANWKLIFENYSECFHCAPVHPALVKLSPADSGANDLVSGPFLGGYMLVKPDCGSMTLSGNACSLPVGDLSPEDHHRVYYYAIFPNMLLSLHPDYVMVHTLWPEAPDRTRIVCEWLFHPDAAAQPDFHPDDGVLFWDQTNREDWHVCELSQLGVSSRAYTPGPYSPRESLSAAFDREYLRTLGFTEADVW
ncbi:MAG TPA: aromatic ring-hydroxylating dioxygenase subunit alpha [Chthonomonadaceae bacterium]|nr:aromatic ring-hydroxylating dioxygenase subunit alpha [Chthonomonadaceae bacterium]